MRAMPIAMTVLGATLSIAAVAVNAVVTPAQAPPARCEAAATLSISAAKVASARTVAAGSFVPAFRTRAVTVPSLCQVVGYAAPTADSRINFELWIPAPGAWNGKLLVFGNGGYSGSVAYDEMARFVGDGYAVMGGDTGHTGDDLRFVIGHPERIADWGTRSVGEIAKAARPVVEAVQGQPVRRTYFSGCSTGGQQGYSAVQHYPEVFDGVVAGAPGSNRIRLNVAFLARYLANRRRGDDSGNVILPASKLPVIASAVVAQCDSLDGVRDGIVDDPRRCAFTPTSLLCTGSDGPACLTREQVAVVERFYSDIRNPRSGELIYPAFPVGAEAGFNQYWGATEPTRADFWRYWAFDNPQFDWWRFDFDRDLAAADARLAARIDQVSVDLEPFRARGGKLLIYQGWNDPVVNALDTIAYYERLRARDGSQAATDAHVRLFLVPGMGHCGGGTGTSAFNMVAALDRWVDQGAPPDTIPASRVRDGAITRTRPLCPYPQVARYQGTGSVDEASSFACVNP